MPQTESSESEFLKRPLKDIAAEILLLRSDNADLRKSNNSLTWKAVLSKRESKHYRWQMVSTRIKVTQQSGLQTSVCS